MNRKQDNTVLAQLIPLCERDANAFGQACERADDVRTRLVLSQLEQKHAAAAGALRRAAGAGEPGTGHEAEDLDGECVPRDAWLEEHLAALVEDDRPVAAAQVVEVYKEGVLEALDEAIVAEVTGPVRSVLVFEKDRLTRAYQQVEHLRRAA